MKKIAFITVNYNNASLTKQFLQNVTSLNSERIKISKKIIIVDNFSRYEDRELLNEIVKEYSGVEVVKSNENLGYFGGLNLGIAQIKDTSEFDFIIVGNNDIEFEHDFLDTLFSLRYPENTFVIAPDVETLDGIHQNPLRINRISRFEKLKNDVYWSNYYVMLVLKKFLSIFQTSRNKNYREKDNTPKYIEAGIGACYILTTNFFQKNSFLNNEVFLWGEEAVLSNQLRLTHGKIWYAPTIHILHFESKTVGRIPARKKYDIVKKSYAVYKDYL